MNLELYSSMFALVQTAVLAVLLFLSIRLLLKNTGSLTSVFLSFSYSLWFLSVVYWLVYDILRPGVRMPFAANEFGEAAMLLMLAAALNTAVPHGSRAATKQVIGAAVFAVFNVVLWIAWSGEWVQDIITGLVILWLMSSVACSLKVVHALSKTEWILLAVYSAVLIACQGLTFFFDDPVKTRIDTGCYVLISAGILYWFAKLFISYKRTDPAKKRMTFAVANMAWITVALFMSAGVFYIVYFNIETLIGVFVFLSARSAVNES